MFQFISDNFGYYFLATMNSWAHIIYRFGISAKFSIDWCIFRPIFFDRDRVMSQFIKFIIVSQNYSVYWVYAQVSGNFRGHLMTTKAEPAKRVCIFGIRKKFWVDCISRFSISVVAVENVPSLVLYSTVIYCTLGLWTWLLTGQGLVSEGMALACR